MSKQVKHYIVVAALSLFLPAVASAGDGGYIQASYNWSSMGDVNAKYRGETKVDYGLDDASTAGDLAVGYKVNNFSVELKLNYAEGEVETVENVKSRKGSEYNWAAVTIGGLYDIERFDIDKNMGMAITPYVGLAGGYDGGYMNGQKDTESSCNNDVGYDAEAVNAGCASGDDRSDYGFVYRATVGALMEVHNNIGFTINYDYLDGTAQNHVWGAGVRLMF